MINTNNINCGLCNAIITHKDNFVICEICYKKIHAKCKKKYYSDVDKCTKCFECGGSIIKTKCCDTSISFDYLCGLTKNYYKIYNIQNSTEYKMLDVIEINDNDNGDKKIYYFNNIKNLFDINQYEYLYSSEYLISNNNLYCIHCIINDYNYYKNYTFMDNNYDLVYNNFMPKLTNEIISQFRSLPYRD